IHGAAMMLRQTKQPAELLRKKITSPGGTTQAGIATLKEYDYEEALLSCITDATNRSQQLGELFQKQN
ncbi:pyrroline-5-carboxylate reductase dimerization domain-containing protein, partial [Micrococcus sp. SIMBA_131]